MATADRPSGHEQPIRILSASIDSGLNHSRALLLRHYGFDVTTSESKEHAREQIERSHFDVLIVGNTLPSDTCWELAKIFRHHNSKVKIIEKRISPTPLLSERLNRNNSSRQSAEPCHNAAECRHHGMQTYSFHCIASTCKPS